MYLPQHMGHTYLYNGTFRKQNNLVEKILRLGYIFTLDSCSK